MKNKIVNYFLITVTLLVWGVIVYRIFDGMDSGNEVVQKETVKRNYSNNIADEKDTFKLINNYRDPFLGNTVRNNFSNNGNSNINESNKPLPSSKTKKLPEPVKQIDWSFIKYIGSVHNTEKKKKVSLISVFGKEYMVGEGEEISGITIIQKEKDSIHIKYEGMQNWIRRH